MNKIFMILMSMFIISCGKDENSYRDELPLPIDMNWPYKYFLTYKMGQYE